MELKSGSSKSCGCLSSDGDWRTGPYPDLSKANRNAEIARRAELGETYTDIARSLGLTRQRVHQIVQYGG